MSENKKCCGNDTLQGVRCDVVSCKYHGGDNCCHASKIKVQSPSAIRRSETFCETFTPTSSV